MAKEHKKVAIVTGAGAGIGRATALRFASDGYRILVVDQSEQKAQEVCDVIQNDGGTTSAVCGDISISDTSQTFSDKAMSLWGRIDALVANAGIQDAGTLVESTEQDWERILGVNLRGVAHSCKSVLPHMQAQKSGAIVMVSSINAIVGTRKMAAYDASKAAVLGLMHSLAIDHGTDGIRVNAICPGNTLTDFHIDRMAEQGVEIDELRQMTRGYALLDRAAEPIEIANAIFFLASEQASFITGHTLVADGGYSIRPD